MSVFFLLVGIEIKRELVDRELSELARAALPLVGALGVVLWAFVRESGCTRRSPAS